MSKKRDFEAILIPREQFRGEGGMAKFHVFPRGGPGGRARIHVNTRCPKSTKKPCLSSRSQVNPNFQSIHRSF